MSAWEPGMPLYERPSQRIEAGDDPEQARPMIEAVDDWHDQRVSMFDWCRVCEDPKYVGYSGLSWAKFVKAVSA